MHEHKDSHAGHEAHGGSLHYMHLAIMAVLSFIAMFILMYAMVDRFANVYGNLNQVYMAALMAAPMIIIELVVMRGMYPNGALNAAIIRAVPRSCTLPQSAERVDMTRGRPIAIPEGSWPRRMPAAMTAGYRGESSVAAFLKRVGTEYPMPRVAEGRRQLWLKDDLDLAIGPNQASNDVAEDL
jgi:hypothetical protein